jgi:hypothetical protein
MKFLPPGRFELQRRCVAVINGKTYFGEVFRDEQRIFVDPQHPSLRPEQWVYHPAFYGNVIYSANSQYVQF